MARWDREGFFDGVNGGEAGRWGLGCVALVGEAWVGGYEVDVMV